MKIYVNTDQIIEVDLNFCSEEVRKKVCSLSTFEEKEELIFKYINMIDTDQCRFYYEKYTYGDTAYDFSRGKVRFIDFDIKKKFIEEIEEKGFYIKKEPFSNIHCDVVTSIYKEFDWIKPYNVYINKFGLRKKIMKPMVVGDKYIYLLKQTSNKNSSFRSTGKMNMCHLPQKYPDKQTNNAVYSHSPISISEVHNLSCGLSMMSMAEHNIFTRSSPIGRQSLKSILATKDNPMNVKKLEVKETYLNSNALIFAQYFKGMGCRLNIVTRDDLIDGEDDELREFIIDGKLIIDKFVLKQFYVKLFDMKKAYVKSIGMDMVEAYEGQKEDMAWEWVLQQEEAKKNPVYNKLKDIVISDKYEEVKKQEEAKKEKENN